MLSHIPAVVNVDDDVRIVSLSMLLLLLLLSQQLVVTTTSFFMSIRFDISNSIPSSNSEFFRPAVFGGLNVVADGDADDGDFTSYDIRRPLDLSAKMAVVDAEIDVAWRRVWSCGIMLVWFT